MTIAFHAWGIPRLCKSAHNQMRSNMGSMITLIPPSPSPSLPSRPLRQKRRVSLAAGKSDAELEPVFFNQLPKALAEELVHVVQACAIVDLTMGAGT